VARLIYAAIASLDGYVADVRGNFDWAAPDEEVHRSVNDLIRPIGTHLYGRRMYEVMVAWESDDMVEGQPDLIKDFAEIWRSAKKIVYSRTLSSPRSSNTTLERDFSPGAVRAMKASADTDISIGGPELAGLALKAGLVDELHLFAVPVVVGDGTHFLPRDFSARLELLHERRFGGGTVHMRYRIRR